MCVCICLCWELFLPTLERSFDSLWSNKLEVRGSAVSEISASYFSVRNKNPDSKGMRWPSLEDCQHISMFCHREAVTLSHRKHAACSYWPLITILYQRESGIFLLETGQWKTKQAWNFTLKHKVRRTKSKMRTSCKSLFRLPEPHHRWDFNSQMNLHNSGG